MLANGRWRGELVIDKQREESKVAEWAEKLKTYKIEIYNCEYLSQRLRVEESIAEAACTQLETEADDAERLAKQAEEEVEQLEWELRGRNWTDKDYT